MKDRLRRQGFTLIELLVVVSIITLLISILLPAVGAARTRARVSAGVQNMKQHAIGMSNYAAANADTLPNAPLAPPDDAEKPAHGIPGRTAFDCCSLDFPVNGFAFQGVGVPTYRAILAGLISGSDDGLPNGSDEWGKMALSYNGYWVVMSQYMTDQEGIDALEDVFYSPSDTEAKRVRDTRSRPYLQSVDGIWPGLGTNQMKQNFVTPSYRYVVAGVLTPQAMDVDEGGDPKGTPNFNLESTQWTREDYKDDGFYQYIRRLPSASVDFPSQKVMFFLQKAVHNRNRDSWFEPGAICPVAMADGSARETVPDRDAIDGGGASGNQAVAANAVKERAGSWLTVRYTVGEDEDGNDITVSYYMPYLVTRGGIRGRDL